MKRLINSYLNQWLIDQTRKPLIQRGACQIGKTYAVRHLGKKTSHFVHLYCWHREARGDQAEVDYVLQSKEEIVPVEVKSATIGGLRGLREYLNSHPNMPYVLRSLF